MAITTWMNVLTGERLDDTALEILLVKARRVYEVNQHIFEHQWEALKALGAQQLGAADESP